MRCGFVHKRVEQKLWKSLAFFEKGLGLGADDTKLWKNFSPGGICLKEIAVRNCKRRAYTGS